MARWALSGPGRGRRGLLMALALGSVTVLLGCGGGGTGGGGGGGGVVGVCGSAPGSVTPVFCGRVYKDGTTAPVAGASVVLIQANGTALSAVQTSATGEFRMNSVPPTGVLFRVDPPADYTHGMVRYGGSVYDYARTASAGGTCVMSTGGTIAGDKSLGTVYTFPLSGPPPPPAFGCPR